MTAKLYTGDTKPIKFTVTDADGPVTPTQAKVFLLRPGNDYLNDLPDANIDGNEVTYNISGTYNNQRGHYKAYFVCTLSYGERTHKVEYEISNNPERE